MRLPSTAAFVLLAAHAAAQAAPMSAKDVMLANEASRKSVTEQGHMVMTLTNAGGETRLRDVLMFIDDTDIVARKTYVRFVTPRDLKDVRMLTLAKPNPDEDEDRWLYLPALRKVRRIAASGKGESFMGTDFSYEDFQVTDGVVGTRNHSYTILREETIPDALGVKKLCWVIEALPSTPKEIAESENSKRVIWVEQEHYTAIQEQYFNKRGVLFKVRTSSDVRPFPSEKTGKTVWRPMRIDMTSLENGHKTVAVMTDFHVDAPIPAKVFTRDYVEADQL